MIPVAQPLSNELVVIFEGIDGVGKTTQLKLAKEALSEAGWPVYTSRNLGGTPIGEALREVLLSPLERPPLTDLYVSLAIQEPLIALIETARKQGKIILLDRGPLSLAAYQIYGTGIDETAGWRYVQENMNRLEPAITLLYEMDVETALQRKRNQADTPDYFESQTLSYFQRVVKGYELARQHYPVEVINAAQSTAEIHEQTMHVIMQAINVKKKH